MHANDEREETSTAVVHLRFTRLPFASLREIFLCFNSVCSRSLFVSIRGRFLFIDRNRDTGFAGVEDDELGWLIGGESAMNCPDGFTQSFPCSDSYMLVCSLFLYG